MIYQIGNIFCLEISGGGLRPPESVRGGANVPRPPCIRPCITHKEYIKVGRPFKLLNLLG